MYFTPKDNTEAEHHAFCKLLQVHHDTVLQYMAALHKIVATWDFGGTYRLNDT